MSAQVNNFSRISDSIIGWGSSTGRWARIDNKSVIGENVHVKVSFAVPHPGHIHRPISPVHVNAVQCWTAVMSLMHDLGMTELRLLMLGAW